jgi:hypothetical protein
MLVCCSPKDGCVELLMVLGLPSVSLAMLHRLNL